MARRPARATLASHDPSAAVHGSPADAAERSTTVDTHPTHVLIAGGGVAALEAALALKTLGHGRLRVELVAPETQFWYRPLAVAEPFGAGEVKHFDLATLVSGAGATLTHGEIVSVDAGRRLAYTTSTSPLDYDRLLLACGTRPRAAVGGAITFRGPADTRAIEQLLGELQAGATRRVVFAVPAGAVWSLPAYELALLTASHLAARRIYGVSIEVVTPEREPLELFGAAASAAAAALLLEAGIALRPLAYPAEARTGELLLVGGDVVPADRVVALPRLTGPRIGGVPQTFDGFVPVDQHGRVPGLPDVYAAGDMTTFEVKQGGIATQQADAAAEAIAADAGLDVSPEPFRPVLRGILLAGDGPRYLHGGRPEDVDGSSVASLEPLWWPPAKIVGRHLAPYLAEATGESETQPPEGAGIVVEQRLDTGSAERLDRLVAAAVDDALGRDDAPRVGDVMAAEPVVVAPEDTLGEVAERLRREDVGSALVAEYGRLIGIVTTRDLLAALAGRVHSSEARVRAWMTADPLTVTPETSLEAAEYLMTSHGIHHLPVVDGERPVGQVGLRDLQASGDEADARLGIGLGF
jgi:sulfide:quinone oxidoreductase